MRSDTLEVGTYNIKVVTQNLSYISESNYVMCVQPEPPTIIIPNVITPNYDGTNDYFVIRNLEHYKENNLVIKNRWGKTIFEKQNYTNDWFASNVPDGVYFGILTYTDNGEQKTENFIVHILH